MKQSSKPQITALASLPVLVLAVIQSLVQALSIFLELFEKDPATEAIVMIGEIGGTAEEEAAAYIKANVTKPVVSYIAGCNSPSRQADGPCWRYRFRW